MSKFVTGKNLSDKVYNIIWEAEEMLFIVSPFIKLDDYFKELFEKHKYNHKLHITIIFGRNEARPSKSLRKEDFDFFKQFKNISIIYCSDLHAKYYANDFGGLLTSINLYDKCFEKNVEYGVYFPDKLINGFISSAEGEALNYTEKLLERYPAVFIKRPVYEKSILNKNYIESSVMYDVTELMLNITRWQKEPKRYYPDFPAEINAKDPKVMPERDLRAKEMPQRKTTSHDNHSETAKGYCIRTGKPIPFDLKRPLCYEAFQSWNQFKNYDFTENYCHKTGKPSYGKTSMRNPVL